MATARLSNTPLNTNETVPSDITLGFDDHFVVFRDNTHLEYNSGFSLYPMYLTLPTNDEVWTLSSSDVSIGGVAEMSSDAIYAYAAGQGKEDSAAITMRADYYNHSGPGTTNFALGTVTGDYGVTHTNDDPHVLLTGVYVGSILLNFQEAGDAIISNVVAGSSFTVFLDGDGSVWAWGHNDKGQLAQSNTAGATGYVNQSTANPQRVLDSNGRYLGTDEEGNVVIRFKAVAAGTDHAVALSQDGRVYTWGYNNLGQLGNGNQKNQLYAAPVLAGAQTTYYCPVC